MAEKRQTPALGLAGDELVDGILKCPRQKNKKGACASQPESTDVVPSSPKLSKALVRKLDTHYGQCQMCHESLDNVPGDAAR